MVKLKQTLTLTPSVEEGPFYTTGSPRRKKIALPGTPGKKLILSGRVLNTIGNPVAHAWLDFWHADSEGVYDNQGFNLRGHQYSDEAGRYSLETIRPRFYLSRAPHIHAKVRAAENAPLLTTQLYFPGEKLNKTDDLFEPGTVMEVKDTPDGQQANFDFVVEV